MVRIEGLRLRAGVVPDSLVRKTKSDVGRSHKRRQRYRRTASHWGFTLRMISPSPNDFGKKGMPGDVLRALTVASLPFDVTQPRTSSFRPYDL